MQNTTTFRTKMADLKTMKAEMFLFIIVPFPEPDLRLFMRAREFVSMLSRVTRDPAQQMFNHYKSFHLINIKQNAPFYGAFFVIITWQIVLALFGR
jgi:hypothetical protein